MSGNVIDLAAKREEANDPIVDEVALTIYQHQSGRVSASFFDTGETNDQHWRVFAGLVWKLHVAIWQHIAKHTDRQSDQIVMMAAIFGDARASSMIDMNRVETPEQFEWLRKHVRGLIEHVDDAEANR